MSRRIIGPFNRVEGDLEVHLEFAQNRVREAWVVSSLYRGFEQILQGKNPMDALVYVPRICGICSVAQSTAAARALAAAQGLEQPPNGELASNLILACENATDHLSHFYLFFMPDFARETYSKEPWFSTTAARFKAMEGTASRVMLPARASFMHMLGLLAGKWPHTLALQPGGTTRAVEVQEKIRIQAILYAFRQFLEQTLFADQLEQIIALDSAAALDAWRTEAAKTNGDFRHFLNLAEALKLADLGRGTDYFMSYGVYADQGAKLFVAGTWNGVAGDLDQARISEDISHSWMQYQSGPRHPFDGVTSPAVDQEGGYTWCKAPRLDGQVVEVGALARQQVQGHPMIRDLVARSGSNVQNRMIARLLEIALLVVAMEGWASRLQPRQAFCQHGEMPDEAQGYGMIEAARGSLGHWLKVHNGRILNYQIIAPTTWNFSPRDSLGQPGTLEQALVAAPVRKGEIEPVAVQHIVRSFDPCMVCTVH